MKNSVTEHEVIEALRAHGAMAVEQLASTVETFKHFVFPVIGSLMKQGYVQKKDTGNGAPVFELGPKTFEITEIQQEPSSPAKTPEAVKPAVALVDAVPAPQAIKTASPASPASESEPQRAKPARLSVVKPTATPVVAQTTASTLIQPSEITLLAYLRICAQRLSAIQEVFGDCDELLATLAEKNLVESAYIIDQYVFSVNHAEVYKLYPQLISEEEAQAIFASASTKVEVTTAPNVEVIAAESGQTTGLISPEAEATTLPPAALEEATTSPVAPAIEPPQIEDEFEENRTVIRDEFAQHEEPVLSGDAVKEIASLVQRLVQSELKKEREKLGEGIDVEAISSKIKKAAVSLRDAAKALEETLSILSK